MTTISHGERNRGVWKTTLVAGSLVLTLSALPTAIGAALIWLAQLH